MNKRDKCFFSVGIMCYNEEGNIRHLLESLRNQTNWHFIREIIVIVSGSTDKTTDLVSAFAIKNEKVKLIFEKKRKGKAHAVNIYLKKALSNILVLISADVLLRKNSLAELVRPLSKKDVGIVGSHPIPINNRKTFFGFAAHLTWELHHQISLENPKMGEMIAFKKCFNKIPVLTSVDEVNIEALIRGQGYKAIYAPRAVIYNKGPETLKEFISRRRSNYFGHLATKHEYSYSVSTLNNLRVFYFIIRNLKFSTTYIIFLTSTIILELIGRILGLIDYRLKRGNHSVWEIAKTTKKLK